MESDRLETNLGYEAEITPDEKIEIKKPSKRFVGKRSLQTTNQKNDDQDLEESKLSVQTSKPLTKSMNQIPKEILEDEDINNAICLLPSNYSFEIHKSIHKIRNLGSKKVALQFPEGLLLFATTISDILQQFCSGIETIIMGDVTYGACCIDDFTARCLDCDLLIHYAHSCLIPVSVTTIKTLYVFVDISIDVSHLLSTIERNFQNQKSIALVGTIQFNSTIHTITKDLIKLGYDIKIPQIKPLSKGEILGCTSPVIKTKAEDVIEGVDILLYLGDGRFHLESAMIHNPKLLSYRYDPYSKRLTKESYNHEELHKTRGEAISKAKKSAKWGLILGTLGRQGNPFTMEKIENKCRERGIHVIKLALSEIYPGKLSLMDDIGAWVQIACPRLSIDWGYAFTRPLLSPYEAIIALDDTNPSWMNNGAEKNSIYPMNYYSKDGLGREVRA